jgi:hypothetical protein
MGDDERELEGDWECRESSSSVLSGEVVEADRVGEGDRRS